MVSEMHEANRRHWDATAQAWRDMRDRDGLWRRCPTEPQLAFAGDAFSQVRQWLGALQGRDACVIGSGDNYAAFALAGCGARVTSVDISQEQLDVAADRASELGLDITFVRADASDMAAIEPARFDLVCSTNGFFVWVAQPERVFSEVARILRPGGYYVFYDVHPFQRPWQDQPGPLAMRKPYWDTGPFPDDEDGTYGFNWTLADLLNGLAAAGLVLRHVVESPAPDARFWQGASYESAADDRLTDWRHNPRAGLPVWLTVVAQRPR